MLNFLYNCCFYLKIIQVNKIVRKRKYYKYFCMIMFLQSKCSSDDIDEGYNDDGLMLRRFFLVLIKDFVNV